jgi:hypothetical protein
MGAHQSTFDFDVAHALVQNLTDAVAREHPDDFVRVDGLYTLTYKGCVDHFNGGGWRKYAAEDIIDRLVDVIVFHVVFKANTT